MDINQKAVLRFNNGTTLKGYMKDFNPKNDKVTVEEAKTGGTHSVRIDELKAIFFIRSFEGNSSHKEKKLYGISGNRGHRLFIKFNDGESLVGFLEGDVPWERGFFLSKHGKDLRGFFILPVDLDSNNIKVFVIASSVKDVTVVP